MAKNTFREKFDSVRDQLVKVGINTTVRFRRVGREDFELLSLNLNPKRDTFSIIINRTLVSGKKRANFENVNLSVVSLDKKYRQAVLELSEPAREITRKVKLYSDAKKPNKSTIVSHFDLTLPPGTKFKVGERIKYEEKYNLYYLQAWLVTAIVPESKSYFLVGYDESHLFVSMLPKKVDSVADAHLALMPPEVYGRSDVLRQGEFFLIPATEKELKKIEATLRKKPYLYSYEDLKWTNRDGSEEYTDHMACNIEIDNTLFITGLMFNERHNLMLNGWYRVIRNLEIPNLNSNSWD